MTNYTLEMSLVDENGTVVWEHTASMEITTTIGFGIEEYGADGYGDSEAP